MIHFPSLKPFSLVLHLHPWNLYIQVTHNHQTIGSIQMLSSVWILPFFVSASLICTSVVSFTNLRFVAARLFNGVVDWTSSFFAAVGLFCNGDFYKIENQTIELNWIDHWNEYAFHSIQNRFESVWDFVFLTFADRAFEFDSSDDCWLGVASIFRFFAAGDAFFALAPLLCALRLPRTFFSIWDSSLYNERSTAN